MSLTPTSSAIARSLIVDITGWASAALARDPDRLATGVPWAMRSILGITGSLGFVYGCYAFLYAKNVMHEIAGMLGFLIAMTGLGAVGIVQAIEKLHARDAPATTAEAPRYYATPAQPAPVEQMHPIARARGRAPTDPGGDGSGSSV